MTVPVLDAEVEVLFVTDRVIEPFPEPEELLTVSQLTSLDTVQFTLDVMLNEADV